MYIELATKFQSESLKLLHHSIGLRTSYAASLEAAACWTTREVSRSWRLLLLQSKLHVDPEIHILPRNSKPVGGVRALNLRRDCSNVWTIKWPPICSPVIETVGMNLQLATPNPEP